MRNSVNIVVSAIVVMALAVLLLAGCQDNYKGLSATPSKNGKELQHHTPIPLGSVNMTTDSSKGDTMTAYIQLDRTAHFNGSTWCEGAKH